VGTEAVDAPVVLVDEPDPELPAVVLVVAGADVVVVELPVPHAAAITEIVATKVATAAARLPLRPSNVLSLTDSSAVRLIVPSLNILSPLVFKSSIFGTA
jgi:hypothetical protein